MPSLPLQEKLARWCGLNSEGLSALARRTGFYLRKPRKLDLAGFVLSCLLLATQHTCSLRGQAMLAGLLSDDTLSKQALWKRLRKAAPFLQAVLAQTLATKLLTPSAQPGRTPFRRILVQDSTCLALSADLRPRFPGPANHTGQAATLRLQTVYDLSSESFLAFALSPFTRNDQAAVSDLLSLLQETDLVLRDLGYFSLAGFSAIAAAKAFFLSRLRFGLALFDVHTGQGLDLRHLLKPDQSTDCEVLLGKKEKLRLRLVAFPLPEAVASERRRKARANRDKRLNPSQEYMHLLGWDIFITNVPAAQLSGALLAQLYRLRGRIEIIFKAWKSHGGLTQFQKLGAHQIEPLLYGRLIMAVLLHALILPALNAHPRPRPPTAPFSLLRLTQALAAYLPTLLLPKGPPGQFLCRFLIQIDKHARYEPRKRLNYDSFRHLALG